MILSQEWRIGSRPNPNLPNIPTTTKKPPTVPLPISNGKTGTPKTIQNTTTLPENDTNTIIQTTETVPTTKLLTVKEEGEPVSNGNVTVSNLIKIYSEINEPKSKRDSTVAQNTSVHDLTRIMREATVQNENPKPSATSEEKQNGTHDEVEYEEITWENIVPK